MSVAAEGSFSGQPASAGGLAATDTTVAAVGIHGNATAAISSAKHQRRTLTILVSGADAVMREKTLCSLIEQTQDSVDSRPSSPPLANSPVERPHTVLILEGLSDGVQRFPVDQKGVHAIRIAPACPCCLGNLAMRVTLNRVLRHPPACLFISLASTAHLEQFRTFLASAPYDTHIDLGDDLVLA